MSAMQVALHDHRPSTLRKLWRMARAAAVLAEPCAIINVQLHGIRLVAVVEVVEETIEVERRDADSWDEVTRQKVWLKPSVELVYDYVGFPAPMPELAATLDEPTVREDGAILVLDFCPSDPFPGGAL